MAIKYLSDIQTARDPQQSTDVANKQYVDGRAGGSVIGAYSANLSTGTTATVTHGLNTTDVIVAVYKLSDGLEIEIPFVRTSVNVVTLSSTVDLAGHRVVVLSSGGATAFSTRTTTAFTTESLATQAATTGTVTLAVGYRLLSITTSRESRVRLYTTSAKRDADVGRATGTDPTGDHGLVLEYVTTASVLSADLSPTVDGFDGKSTPDGVVYYSVTNLGGAGTVTVTFKWIRTE